MFYAGLSTSCRSDCKYIASPASLAGDAVYDQKNRANVPMTPEKAPRL